MIKCGVVDDFYFPLSVTDKNIECIQLYDDANIATDLNEFDEIEQKLKELHNEVGQGNQQQQHEQKQVKVKGDDDSNLLLEKNMKMLKSNNFAECCRSCGKTNVQLYELFGNINNNNNKKNMNVNSILTANSSCSNSDTPNNKRRRDSDSEYDEEEEDEDEVCEPPQHRGAVSSNNRKSKKILNPNKAREGNAAAIASAKATAQGYNNMENIFQEMQLWQLRVSFD